MWESESHALPLGDTPKLKSPPAECASASGLNLAGVAGFEPTRARVKVSCLTAWRHPNEIFNLFESVLRRFLRKSTCKFLLL